MRTPNILWDSQVGVARGWTRWPAKKGPRLWRLTRRVKRPSKRFQRFTESSLKKSGAMWCDAKLAKSVWCIASSWPLHWRGQWCPLHLTHFPKHDYQRRDRYIQWYKIEFAVDVTVLPGHPHCLESCPFPHLVIIGLKLVFVFLHCRLPSSLCCRHSVPISVEMLGTAKELWMWDHLHGPLSIKFLFFSWGWQWWQWPWYWLQYLLPLILKIYLMILMTKIHLWMVVRRCM